MSVHELSDDLEARRIAREPARRSYWLIGLTLLIAVLLSLGGATVLNQRLRPKAPGGQHGACTGDEVRVHPGAPLIPG
jgi:hypothetical protein